jgi:excisionase family DNA binding protein
MAQLSTEGFQRERRGFNPAWTDGASAVGSGPHGFAGDNASRLLEAEDVANYLGMRTHWVYREVRAGRLPHIRLGRAVRFRRESIEAWLVSRERGVPAARRRP